MTKQDFVIIIRNFLLDENINFTKEALDSFTKRSFFNERLLAEMKRADVEKNLNSLFNDILRHYQNKYDHELGSQAWREKKGRIGKKMRENVFLEEDDVREIIAKRFCGLPPFCK